MSIDPSKRVILAILDGWGIAQPTPGNAIGLAKTPNLGKFWASYPHTELKASGEAVGLPRNEPGNTETGHLNIGAGRIVYQDLERINMSIADNSFFKNQTLIAAINHAKKNNSALHLIGLVGAGGVHSNMEHLFALIQMAKNENFNRVFVHVITDGRDSPPTSSQTYIERLREFMQKEGVGTIASVMGRYWAMDRDRRWERTEIAYNALTKGTASLVKTSEEAIKSSYGEGITDEFIKPALITDPNGKPIAQIVSNDAVIFFNFRIDRPRQLTAAFMVSDFKDNSLSLDFDPYLEKYEKTNIQAKIKDYQKVFNRGPILNNLFFVTMTEYSASLVASGTHTAYPPEKIINSLGKVLSDANLKQLRMSESEKERFVTFYFNGQVDEAYKGEDRIIVPSQNVPTYDQKPEMSAYEITDRLLKEASGNADYSFIVVNFANADMVGHTGNIGPAVRACEVVDECIGKVANYILAYGGTLLITADHGNAEEMINLHSGQVDTEHSVNPVPFIVVSNKYSGNAQTLQPGILADIAPTVLTCLEIPIPTSMTGKNLINLVSSN